jgi:hemerythrin superfamily protein
MDAISFLKADHKTVEALFKEFEQAGDRAVASKRRIVKNIIRELSVHAAIEEQVLYPSVRREVEGIESEVLESLEEHHIVKWVLAELEGMDPRDERFQAKVIVLIENVRHHVNEEETSMFPDVRAALGRKRLGEIGVQLENAKRLAPIRPHPRSPDTPPGNKVVSTLAGTFDKARSALKV